MPNISEEDCRALELKIHAEIEKIFSAFVEDLEKRTAESAEMAPVRRTRRSGRRQTSSSTGVQRTATAPKKSPRARKTIDTNRILHGISPAVKNHAGARIEDDMAKIFRKKHRRSSQPDASLRG